jgi:hypothetical protein
MFFYESLANRVPYSRPVLFSLVALVVLLGLYEGRNYVYFGW